MKYKTKNGFLCNNANISRLYPTKQWCYIDKQKAMEHNLLAENKLEMDNKGNYWDWISETLEKTQCMDNNKEYKICSPMDKLLYMKYVFGVFLSLSVPQIVAAKHSWQTLNLIGKSDIEILEFMLEQFKKELSQNKIDDLYIKIIYDELHTKLDALKYKNNTKTEIGKLLKEILTISRYYRDSQYSELYAKYSDADSQKKQPATSVIDFLIEKIPDEHVLEILKGANFVIEDDGALYNYSQEKMNGYARFSSHAKNSTAIQIGVTDTFADTYLHMLCGTFKYENGQLVSWCQFEGAPMPRGLTTSEVFKNILLNGGDFNGLQQYIDHFADSEIYFGIKSIITILGGKAVNLAIGTSPHTDKNPMYLLPFDLDDTQTQYIKLKNERNFKGTLMDNKFIGMLKTSAAIHNRTLNFNKTSSNNILSNAPSFGIPLSIPKSNILSNNLLRAGRKTKSSRKIKRKTKRRVKS
jgi:hypothetical protein